MPFYAICMSEINGLPNTFHEIYDECISVSAARQIGTDYIKRWHLDEEGQKIQYIREVSEAEWKFLNESEENRWSGFRERLDFLPLKFVYDNRSYDDRVSWAESEKSLIEYREMPKGFMEQTGKDLFKGDAEIIVNPVNCKGVMGKGLALQFKTKYPSNFKFYADECKKGNVRPGKVLVYDNTLRGENPRYIVNFPTKDDWREPSTLEYIREGLKDLVKEAKEMYWQSIAIPPLGCGLGGLNWKDVKSMIKEAFEPLKDVMRIDIYEPQRTAEVTKNSGEEVMDDTDLADLVCPAEYSTDNSWVNKLSGKDCHKLFRYFVKSIKGCLEAGLGYQKDIDCYPISIDRFNPADPADRNCGTYRHVSFLHEFVADYLYQCERDIQFRMNPICQRLNDLEAMNVSEAETAKELNASVFAHEGIRRPTSEEYEFMIDKLNSSLKELNEKNYDREEKKLTELSKVMTLRQFVEKCVGSFDVRNDKIGDAIPFKSNGNFIFTPDGLRQFNDVLNFKVCVNGSDALIQIPENEDKIKEFNSVELVGTIFRTIEECQPEIEQGKNRLFLTAQIENESNLENIKEKSNMNAQDYWANKWIQDYRNELNPDSVYKCQETAERMLTRLGEGNNFVLPDKFVPFALGVTAKSNWLIESARGFDKVSSAVSYSRAAESVIKAVGLSSEQKTLCNALCVEDRLDKFVNYVSSEYCKLYGQKEVDFSQEEKMEAFSSVAETCVDALLKRIKEKSSLKEEKKMADEVKKVQGQSIGTERGSLYCKKVFRSAEEAEKEGYSYAFTAHKTEFGKVDIWDKVVSSDPTNHLKTVQEHVIVTDLELVLNKGEGEKATHGNGSGLSSNETNSNTNANVAQAGDSQPGKNSSLREEKKMAEEVKKEEVAAEAAKPKRLTSSFLEPRDMSVKTFRDGNVDTADLCDVKIGKPYVNEATGLTTYPAKFALQYKGVDKEGKAYDFKRYGNVACSEPVDHLKDAEGTKVVVTSQEFEYDRRGADGKPTGERGVALFARSILKAVETEPGKFVGGEPIISAEMSKKNEVFRASNLHDNFEYQKSAHEAFDKPIVDKEDPTVVYGYSQSFRAKRKEYVNGEIKKDAEGKTVYTTESIRYTTKEPLGSQRIEDLKTHRFSSQYAKQHYQFLAKEKDANGKETGGTFYKKATVCIPIKIGLYPEKIKAPEPEKAPAKTQDARSL